MSKKLILLGEGDGDCAALPVLAKRIITEKAGWDALRFDRRAPLRIGGVGKLVRDNCRRWIDYLRFALHRGDVGAVLVVLDGDDKCYPPGSSSPFCAAVAAKDLVSQARSLAQAGSAYSLAVVFACMEYESWLIAGVSSLAGKALRDGRPGVRPNTQPPPNNLEREKRGAKQWLAEHMQTGYNEPLDQAPLTEMVDFGLIRTRVEMRSFRRLEHAIEQLIDANRSGFHVATPLAE
ncbi:MAG: DUF4276 family protein [Planctomycetota bacterium]|nr:DUF4276 family protein [Planctomycetota bacterium]